jgi:hypothetical protein
MHDYLEILIAHSAQWVQDQRRKHRVTSQPLPVDVATALAPYFSPQLLSRVRVDYPARIEHPDFLQLLEGQGFPPLPDFREMAGITFGDVICLAREYLPAAAGERSTLFFHECVHVVQYQILGVDEFIRQYVGGWAANGYHYEAIPLELQAFAITSGFQYGRCFDVDERVRRELAESGEDFPRSD